MSSHGLHGTHGSENQIWSRVICGSPWLTLFSAVPWLSLPRLQSARVDPAARHRGLVSGGPACRRPAAWGPRRRRRSARQQTRSAQLAPSGTELCSGRREWVEPMPPRVSGQRSRCRRVLRRVGTHCAPAGSKPDCSRHGHAGLRQGHGRTAQHRATRRGGGGMDFRPAVESSAAGVASEPPKSCRRAARNNRVCGRWPRSSWCTVRNISRY